MLPADASRWCLLLGLAACAPSLVDGDPDAESEGKTDGDATGGDGGDGSDGSDGGDGIDGGDGTDGSGDPSTVYEGDDEVEWAGGSTVDTSVDFFLEDQIQVVELDLGRSAQDALNRSPTTYVEGVVRWNDLELPIGVRLKGSSSLDNFYGKPSMKFDFDFVIEGMRVGGQKKLNLHNMRYDPMKISEALNYALWREAGLPASRTGFARVSVDGVDYGLYSIVETPDDPLLKQWYDDPDGNLYENRANYCDFDDGASCFEAEESDEGNHDALDEIIAAVNAPGGGMDPVRDLLDWDRYTGFLAMEASLAHWDSYSFDQSNFRWYHEPTTNTWSLIPASMDLGYGYRPWSYSECGRHGVDPGTYTMGVISARCWADEACENAVMDKMLEAADHLEATDAPARLRALADMVRDDVYSDPRKSTTNSHFEVHVDCVEAWLAQRPDELRAWVAARRAD